ncbi:MAG: asparagine synthase (glutamine-hydrolyzing) [Clostridia bacterium]|nr:asparagine synthase (glutamine-hydrolyzing) [Clostridia bacterium]
MCSICGIIDFQDSDNVSPALAEKMGLVMAPRGPDMSASFSDGPVAFHHNRLAVVDVLNGAQPMTRIYRGHEYTIVYNGEIYNAPELTAALHAMGAEFSTRCDTEVVLYAYILLGKKCPDALNGIFAFAVYDKSECSVFFARDRLGVKPLCFYCSGTSLLFASEEKALLMHPSVSPRVSMPGLWQLLFLAPAKLPGKSVFRDIFELKPGHRAVFDRSGLHTECYWKLRAEPFSGDEAEAVLTTRELVSDAVRRQLVSDVPLCTLLSGGLDSSVLTAVASEEYKNSGLSLATYSFEYAGNRENFHASLFQPQGDDAYAVMMAEYLGTDHTIITLPSETVEEELYAATLARDMPGQADIDSSLLAFCRIIKKRHTVALSGECSDEIFGGYPWFYRPEMLKSRFFPWIHEPMLRASLFRSAAARPEEGYDYLSTEYRKLLKGCPTLASDSPVMVQSREATWLSTSLFMASLLERKDRMSMAASVEIRVPFADHRIIEYVWNVPWEMKFRNGVEKSLLRDAMSDYLPPDILQRKKSPYPKTFDPKYEKLVTDRLVSLLTSGSSRLAELLDRRRLDDFLSHESATWLGQLMQKPQLIAWLIQFEYWLQKYDVVFAE